MVVGTGADALVEAGRTAGLLISASPIRVVGPRASEFVEFGAGLPLQLVPPDPFYLREPDAKPPGPLPDILASSNAR